MSSMPSVSTADQLLYYKKRVQELEQIEAEEQQEKEAIELELLQKVAAMGYTITEKEIPEKVEDEEIEVLPWYTEAYQWVKKGLDLSKISSNKGLSVSIVTFALSILAFAWYPRFFPLNDSEQRIFNAATLHFISHVWMGIGIFLLGLGFQFLFFNTHFRYLWTNIDTRPSADVDFVRGEIKDLLRLSIGLATFILPVWIFANMFQLILG